MRTAPARALSIALVLLAIVVAGVTVGGAPSSAEVVDVDVRDTDFAPGDVTIQVGDTVRWSQSSLDPHTVTADGGAFGSPFMEQGDVFTHTFTTPGIYPYYCELHGAAGGIGMSGVVIVVGEGTTTTSTSTSTSSSTSTSTSTSTTSTTAVPGPFTDVSVGHPFAPDISWLVDEEIATGYPDGSFQPSSPVSRQAMAAFLHRYADPDGHATCTTAFTDLNTTNPFCAAITWLVDQGITTGYPDDTFKPGAPVTRQATAAFLHRYADGQG